MNNLIFNTTASELKASMYGYNQDTLTLQQIQLDPNGNMLVSGDVTITNETLTVIGDVTITNETLTVIGDVTITNETLTVQIAGQTFTSSTETLTDVTGTGTVFADTNIASLTTASMFINNIGDTTVTYSLQLSPDGIVYFYDPSYTNMTVPTGTNTIIAIAKYAQFAQLQYSLGVATASFIAYYNGQA
ncbi:MAG: DUF6385 domain-containing protein [Lachnospiraceae bacterium]|nr:DUF6385 domain-containing protein [Lachnospiraceae bacterium]